MIPAADEVERAVRALEIGVHRQGWDKSPSVMALMHNGRTLLPAPLPVMLQEPLGEFMLFWANYLKTTQAGRQMAVNMADENFAGLALVSESWANSSLSPQEREADPRKLADIPGSYESRDVLSVDTAGRLFMLHRQRGMKPLAGMSEVTGRIPLALLSIVLTVAELMPSGTANVQALREVHLLTRDEAQDIIEKIREQQALAEQD